MTINVYLMFVLRFIRIADFKSGIISKRRIQDDGQIRNQRSQKHSDTNFQYDPIILDKFIAELYKKPF